VEQELPGHPEVEDERVGRVVEHEPEELAPPGDLPDGSAGHEVDECGDVGELADGATGVHDDVLDRPSENVFDQAEADRLHLGQFRHRTRTPQ